MPDAKANSLEYLCKVYKGLSPKHKEYVLDTARSLLKVQVGKNSLDESESASPGKRGEATFLDSSPVCTGEKK